MVNNDQGTGSPGSANGGEKENKVDTELKQPPAADPKPENQNSEASDEWQQSKKQLNNKGIAPETMEFGEWNPAPTLREHHQRIPANQELEEITQEFADVRKIAALLKGNQNSEQQSTDPFLSGFNEDLEDTQGDSLPKFRNPTLWNLAVNGFKQGYNNAARGQEAWKLMNGQENELEKYEKLLNSDGYRFEADDWWEKMISGASRQFGQWGRQITDPDTLAMATGASGAALLLGQAGPQALLPEEAITVPSAFMTGLTAGNAKSALEIEGGLAYLEMLGNGVSEKTARAIATGVGVVNAGLEFAQLDELMKAYKVLNKTGADDSFLKIILRELTDRGIDIAKETGQEILQEGVTIAGTQLGSKLDTGELAYSFGDVTDRLWNTAKDSVLTFGLTNIPSVGHNIGAQNHTRATKLAAQGEARLRSGEMPTPEQLKALNISEAEARGRLVLYQMEKVDEGANFDDTQQGRYNPLDKELLQELIHSGEKHNPDDIVAITKTADSKLVWLETGTERAGLKHIVEKHTGDFMNQGVSSEELPSYVMSALQTGKIVGYQGRGNGRPIYEFVYNGRVCRVAITVSNNGFVVGANPK